MVAVAFALAFSVLFVAVEDKPAQAFVAPPPVFIPASVATVSAALAEAAGAAATISSAGGAAAAAGTAVAAAPVAVVAGAALVTAGALYLGWKWISGHQNSYADTAGTPGGSWAGSTTQQTPQSGDAGCCGGVFVVQAAPAPNAGGTLTLQAKPSSTCGASWCSSLDLNYYYEVRFLPGQVPASTIWAGNSVPRTQSFTVPANKTGFCLYSYTSAACGASYSFAPSQGGVTNPTVTTTPTSQCTPTGGGAVQIVTGPPITYSGSTSNANLPQIVVPACPAGTYRSGFSTPSTAGGATAPSPLAPWSAPTIPSAFPECQPHGNCVLTLLQISPAGDTLLCNRTQLCNGWSTLPRLAPKRTGWKVSTATQLQYLVPTGPRGETYRCIWGPYELEPDECTPIQLEPPPDAPPAPDPVPDPENPNQNCLKDAWSWNPIDWVFVPVKCALTWAFQPPPGYLQTKLQDAGDAWSGNALATGTSAAGDVFGPIAALGDDDKPNCLGPLVVIPVPPSGAANDLSIRPLNACNELTQMVLSYWIPLASGLIYLACGMGAYHGITRAAGIYQPTVKAR